jgi:hypothetical protein
VIKKNRTSAGSFFSAYFFAGKARITTTFMAATTKNRKPLARKAETKAVKKDLAKAYNQYKTYEGKQYTGMKVGRTHKWYYDKGEWKEKKLTPDQWEISYAVTKRRAGKAPEGSGVPVGTEYHWYILAHQLVRKLNANDYTTAMTGFKFKVAHKRADKEKWSASERAQRRQLIRILNKMIKQLQQEEAQDEKNKKSIVVSQSKEKKQPTAKAVKKASTKVKVK